MKLSKYVVATGIFGAMVFTATAAFAESAPFGNDGSQLALGEKKLVKVLQDTNIPDFIAHVEKQCGVNLKVQVDWNSFANDENGLKAFNLYALEHVSGALDEMCTDDMSKAAVKKGLSTYNITNVKADKKKADLANGTLTMEAGFGAEWSEGAVGQATIKELFEDKL